MVCPDCNGTGAVTKYNTRDDSGDSKEICEMCGGHGYIALVDNKKV